MVKSCLAFGCHQKFTKNNDVSFYSLPKEPERLKKWLKALRQKSLDVRSFHVICSKHFKETDFLVDESGRKILKQQSVPTIFDKKFRGRRKTVKKPTKTSGDKIQNENMYDSKYNFRQRKSSLIKDAVANENKLKRKDDHTYSTLKPEVTNSGHSEKSNKNTDHTYSSNLSDPKKLEQQPKTLLGDHTYTRNESSKASNMSKHNEHNYSLNTKKVNSFEIKQINANIKSENSNTVKTLKHVDHSYLGAGEYLVSNTRNDSSDFNVVKEDSVVTLDLRDHTYSKANKKSKKPPEPKHTPKSNRSLKVGTIKILSNNILIQKVELNQEHDIPEQQNINPASGDQVLATEESMETKLPSNEASLEKNSKFQSNDTSLEKNSKFQSSEKTIMADSTDSTSTNKNSRMKLRSTKPIKKGSKTEKSQGLAPSPLDTTDCVLLTQIAQESIPTSDFNRLRSDLTVLEPQHSGSRCSTATVVDKNDLKFAPRPFLPVYVLVDRKILKNDAKEDKAMGSMENASKLFEEVFGRKFSTEKIMEFKDYENDNCCQRYTDELLRRCAVRRRFAQPRYVGDYTLADMSCEKNAKRYYELTKTRMDSQKFLIRKLRTQNARLNQRFKRMSQEISKIKRQIFKDNKKQQQEQQAVAEVVAPR